MRRTNSSAYTGGTIRSSLPQTTSVGDLDPVDALLQSLVGDRPQELSRRAHGPLEPHAGHDPGVGILRGREHPPGGLAVGVPKDVAGEVPVRQEHPVGNRRVVAPEAERVDEHQATDTSRAGRRHLAGDHAAEGVAHERRPGEPERVEELVVAEDQIPHAVEVVDVVGALGAGPGMLRSVDREAPRQLVQERVPGEAPGTVEEDDGRSLALGQDAHVDLVLPDGDGPRGRSHQTAARAVGAGVASRRPRGHQWFSHPSSFQMPRRCGSDLAGQEADVLQGQLVGHRPDLHEQHQVPHAETLDDLLFEALADGGGTPGDDVAALREVPVAEVLGVLRPAHRVAYGGEQAPVVLVPRRREPRRRDVQALVVEVLDVPRVFHLGAGVRLGYRDQLEEAGPVRIGLTPVLRDDLPVARPSGSWPAGPPSS